MIKLNMFGMMKFAEPGRLAPPAHPIPGPGRQRSAVEVGHPSRPMVSTTGKWCEGLYY